MKYKVFKIIAMSLALLLSAAYAMASDNDGLFKVDGLTYQLVTGNGNPYFSLVDIDKEVKDVVILENLTSDMGTYPVITIQLDKAYDIESITIPSTINAIWALDDKYSYERTAWPENLKYVRIADLKAWTNIEFYSTHSMCSEIPRGLSNPLLKPPRCT